MGNIGALIFIGLVKCVAFFYTILTLPIYWAVQQPWKVRRESRKLKARVVSNDSSQITYESTRGIREIHEMLNKEQCYTLESMLRLVANNFKNKRCLGTRDILAEEDEIQPDGKVFKKLRMGEYKWRTYDEVELEAQHFGKGMRELGMSPREKVVIFGETRAEWMIAAQGLFKQACTVCTIYATLGEDGVAFGINETEVKYVITTHDLMPRIRKILPSIPSVHTVVFIEDQLNPTDSTGFGNVRTVAYKQVIQHGRVNKHDQHRPLKDDIAILMYTSGSTGVPKGVMLSHLNCMTVLRGFSDGLEAKRGDIFLGLLPLAHVYELLAESAALLIGIPIGYSTALTLLDTMPKVKTGTLGDARQLCPSAMTAVPLILDRVRKGIMDKVALNSPIQIAMFNHCVKYKRRWMNRGYRCPIVDAIVFKKVAAAMGGNLRAMISGGAPLSADTHEFIRIALSVSVVQGYGLTETTAGGTAMEQSDISTGRTGGPTTINQIRLINWEEGNYRVTNRPYPQGEILIGGDNIAMGYFKRPELNDESFFVENGRRWFRTGDIGEVHEDGSVKIIDRKKDLVKLQHGEYISLGKVESELKTCPFIENACVIADSTKTYCVALIAPAEIGFKNLAASVGISGPLEILCDSPDVQKVALKTIQDHGVKCKLAKFEIPTMITLCKDLWTPESELVTAAFKIKRRELHLKYKEDITRMYS